MANEEHLALLMQGVDVWNRWRHEHPWVRPYLREAYLDHAALNGANLSEADLRGPTVAEGYPGFLDMDRVYLREADLRGANLRGAGLIRANLRGANLRGADLIGADLSEADLIGADLSEAEMYDTVLNDLDLSQVKGLETVVHHGPSDIGIQTIYQSRGQIPESFLRGAGVPENFIEYMHSLTGKAFVYYSCFISHSSKDKAFCQRLYNDLQAAGVRCWLDSEDLKIGEKFWERIDESIRLHDKLLVILSEHSVMSDWVEDEVMRATNKERQQEQTVLFPIRLDDSVMNARKPWATSIKMNRHIGDFCAWKDHDAYQQAFARLLRDLQAEGSSKPGE